MTDISNLKPLFTIEANGKKLLVIYDKSWPCGIDSCYKSDEEMVLSLKSDFDSIFPKLFEDVGDGNTYILNINRVEDFAYFNWDSSFGRTILKEQMEVFGPYIKAFIIESYNE